MSSFANEEEELILFSPMKWSVGASVHTARAVRTKCIAIATPFRERFSFLDATIVKLVHGVGIEQHRSPVGEFWKHSSPMSRLFRRY